MNFLRLLSPLLLITPLFAAEFEVTTTDDLGPGSLRAAVASANAEPGEDTITFAASLGDDVVVGLATGALEITDTTGRVLITAEALAAPVTLSGGITSRIFEVSPGAELELVDLILEDGLAPPGIDGIDGVAPSAGGHGEDGGAIYNEGTLTLIRCLFQWNMAGTGGLGGMKTGVAPAASGKGGNGGKGGAVYSVGVGAVVRLEETEFYLNDAGIGGASGDLNLGAIGTIGTAGTGGSGGAIFCESGSLQIVQSVIHENRAGKGGSGGSDSSGNVGAIGGTGGRGGNGGGIALDSVDLTIIDTTIRNNNAGDGGLGGAVGGTEGAGGDGGDGGGLWAFAFLPTTSAHVSGSLFAGNQAGDGIRGGNSPDLANGIGTAGGKGGDGGGLFVVGKPEVNLRWIMQNSTVFMNASGYGGHGGAGSSGGTGGAGGDAGNGGGLAFSHDGDDYTALLSHVTIISNFAGLSGQEGLPSGAGDGADASGGGVWEIPGGINTGQGITLANTVVAANEAYTDTNISAGFTAEGTNVTSGNPLLGILSNNGGPTQTVPPLRGSPLINSGGDITLPLLTDQRGAIRPFNNVPDIGAFEIALQPDTRIGSTSNPATHRIDNYYTSTGAGQLESLKLSGRKKSNFYISVQNDGEITDDITLSGTDANRSIVLSAYRMTGGFANVTAQLRLGYTVADMEPDETAVFQVTVNAFGKKKKKKKKTYRAKQTLIYRSRSEGIPLADTVIADVTQKKKKKRKKR